MFENGDYSIIAVPAIGAIIGYCTNWVAIKMLFRPHKPKKLFGIPIPFTPGLIPKERERIAAAIGEVVGNYLLTEDVIIKELTSDTAVNSVVEAIDEGLFQQKDTIDFGYLLKRASIDLEHGWLRNKCEEKIFDLLQNEEIIDEIATVIEKEITALLKDSHIKSLLNEGSIVEKGLTTFWSSEDAKQMVTSLILKQVDGNKSVKILLGNEGINTVKQAIQFNEPAIKEGIRGLLHDEQVAESVKQMISAVIESKLGALGAMFANPDSIYESIVVTVEGKLEESELSPFIINRVEPVFEKPLSSFVPENMLNITSEHLAERILDPEVKEGLMDVLKESDKSLLDISKAVLPEPIELHIKQAIKGYLIKWIGNEEKSKMMITRFVNRMIELMKQSSLSLPNTAREALKSTVAATYSTLVNKYIPSMVKKGDLTSIVEKQINSFEITMLEKIILSIAKKELGAITWLGALLGFIMSLLYVLIL